MKTFDDGGGIYEVSSTQDAHEVRVELGNLYPGRPMHVEKKEQQSLRAEGEQVKTKERFVNARRTIWTRLLFAWTVLKQHNLLCRSKNNQRERCSLAD